MYVGISVPCIVIGRENPSPMDLQLRGKKTLVSASTAGIGYAIAEGLSREGATVIVNDRTEARASRRP